MRSRITALDYMMPLMLQLSQIPNVSSYIYQNIAQNSEDQTSTRSNKTCKHAISFIFDLHVSQKTNIYALAVTGFWLDFFIYTRVSIHNTQHEQNKHVGRFHPKNGVLEHKWMAGLML